MKKIIFDKTCAEIASFTTADSEVAEHHVMIHVTDKMLPFDEQLRAIDAMLTLLLKLHDEFGFDNEQVNKLFSLSYV